MRLSVPAHRRLAPAAALAVLVLAGFVPAADADTFCVSAPACSGTPESTLASALAASAANGGGRDRIEIGPGIFDTGANLIDAAGNPVDIVGAGVDQTALIHPAGLGTVPLLNVLEPTSTVSDVEFRMADGGGHTGINSFGTTERVRFTHLGTTAAVTGASLRGTAVLRSATADLPAGGSSGVQINPGAQATVEDVSVDSTSTGIEAFGGGTIRRVRLRSNLPLNFSSTSPAALTLEDAVLEVLPGVNTPTALSSTGFSGAGADASLSATHVTATTTDPASSVAVEARALTGTASATITNSTFSGFATDVKRATAAGTTANVSLDFSNYDVTKRLETGGGAGAITDGSHNVTVEPRFVDAAARDLRLRGDSPLVDRADAASPLGGESATDADGHDRKVDGDGNGNARADIGALEYRRQAPTITATSAVPATALTGSPVHFSASGADADGDALSFKWVFDDGTVADGAEVDHAFGAAGLHAATVTVTDSGGLTATAAVPVQVDDPPAGGGGPGGAPPSQSQPAGPGDTLAPGMTLATRSLRATRGGTVDVRLRCPAAEQSGPCAGTVVLKTAKRVAVRRGARRKVVTLGRGTFSIASGKTGRARIRLSKANRSLLRRLRRMKVKATIDAHDQAGNGRATTGTLSLRAP